MTRGCNDTSTLPAADDNTLLLTSIFTVFITSHSYFKNIYMNCIISLIYMVIVNSFLQVNFFISASLSAVGKIIMKWKLQYISHHVICTKTVSLECNPTSLNDCRQLTMVITLRGKLAMTSTSSTLKPCAATISNNS